MAGRGGIRHFEVAGRKEEGRQGRESQRVHDREEEARFR